MPNFSYICLTFPDIVAKAYVNGPHASLKDAMFKSSLNLSTELRKQFLVKANIHLLLESLKLSDTLFKKSLELLKASKFIA